jgi:hypothetical protein
MSSPAKQTATIRKRKLAKIGNKRKSVLRNKGTTPTAEVLFSDEKTK